VEWFKCIQAQLFIYVHANAVRSYCRNTTEVGTVSRLHFADDLATGAVNGIGFRRSNSVYTGTLQRTEAEDKCRGGSGF
jgi:hypothetical protein